MRRSRHGIVAVLLPGLVTLLAAAPAIAEEFERLRAPTAPILSAISVAIVTTTLGLVAIAVLGHYEALTWLSRTLSRLARRGRARVLVLVLALFTLHVAEIWLFGFGYAWLLRDPAYGSLHGPQGDTLLDYIYFSAVIFTTLGLGDLVPSGSIRFLVGIEALAGFMLISWSAAFTYLEMERFWRKP